MIDLDALQYLVDSLYSTRDITEGDSGDLSSLIRLARADVALHDPANAVFTDKGDSIIVEYRAAIATFLTEAKP